MQLKVSGGPQFSCLFLAACSGSAHQLELFEATGAGDGNHWNSVWLLFFSLSSVSSVSWRGGKTKLFASVSAGCLEHELPRKPSSWQDRCRPAVRPGWASLLGRNSQCGHHKTSTMGQEA